MFLGVAQVLKWTSRLLWFISTQRKNNFTVWISRNKMFLNLVYFM